MIAQVVRFNPLFQTLLFCKMIFVTSICQISAKNQISYLEKTCLNFLTTFAPCQHLSSFQVDESDGSPGLEVT